MKTIWVFYENLRNIGLYVELAFMLALSKITWIHHVYSVADMRTNIFINVKFKYHIKLEQIIKKSYIYKMLYRLFFADQDEYFSMTSVENCSFGNRSIQHARIISTFDIRNDNK